MQTECVDVEDKAKEMFEENRKMFFQHGELELMKERIEKLETAVSHLMAFIAFRMELSEEEIEEADGLLDF